MSTGRQTRQQRPFCAAQSEGGLLSPRARGCGGMEGPGQRSRRPGRRAPRGRSARPLGSRAAAARRLTCGHRCGSVSVTPGAKVTLSAFQSSTASHVCSRGMRSRGRPQRASFKHSSASSSHLYARFGIMDKTFQNKASVPPRGSLS